MIDKKTREAIENYRKWGTHNGVILADAVEAMDEENAALKELLGQCRSSIREDYKRDNRRAHPIIIDCREILIARIEEKLK